MQYKIETLDGYNFHYEATEDDCVDLVHGDNADFSFANEQDLLAWVAQEIDNIGLFERIGTDPIISQFINSGDFI